MALSRQHYEAVANIFSERLDFLEWLGENREAPVAAAGEREYYPATVPESIQQRQNDVCDVAKHLAKYFQHDNPRFNMPKFITRAGCLDYIKVGDL